MDAASGLYRRVFVQPRVESGEINLSGSVALEGIAACVIVGVSLRGRDARVEIVVLGAVVLLLMQNGMNVMQIWSYRRMILLDVWLVVVIDPLLLSRRALRVLGGRAAGFCP